MPRLGWPSPIGFSLIEVLIAIGLLASVLLSVASLFVLSSRTLKAGRSLTEATVLAQSMSEWLGAQSFEGTYLGLGASAVDSTWTADSADPGGPLSRWRSALEQDLDQGEATVQLEALGSGAPTFGTAAGLRVIVTVAWSDLGRPRRVTLASARF